MKDTIEQLVGSRIRSLREREGIGKTQFCLMAGISRPYLDHIESGNANVTLKMLNRLAECLNVSASDLVRQEPRA